MSLYAGPWIGEFGWELCWWNPVVRHIAKQYDRVVVSACESSRYLYEFADEFICVDGVPLEFCRGEILSPPLAVKADRHLYPQQIFDADKVGTRMKVRPGRRWRWRGMPFDWRDLGGSSSTKVADVMCAFRPPKIGSDGTVVDGKDYPVAMCQELINALLASGLTAACYGGTDNYHFDGTVDLRGSPLREQCSALSGAGCAVGPSSGPLHLASLCRCPHVTWYGAPGQSNVSRARYEFQWNPFSTPVSFMSDLSPDSTEVAARVREMLMQSGG